MDNKANLTSMKKGENGFTRELHQRRQSVGRFNQPSVEVIEWIRVGKNMKGEAKTIRKMLQRYYRTNQKRNRRNLIEMVDLGYYDGIENIQAYFDDANRQNNPTFLITAYTDDTEFYTRLNRALASIHDLNSRDPKQRQLLDFLQIICCHSDFERYEIRSTTYRGMQMTMDEFEQYKVGSKIMTKTLLSTSQKKEKALCFTTATETYKGDVHDRISCLCIYHIRKNHTALAIEDLSVFRDEQEVLILPYAAFEVVNIGTISSDHGSIATIELRQCQSDIPTYAMITAGGGFLAAAIAGAIAFFDEDN